MSILTGAEARAIAEQTLDFKSREGMTALKLLNVDSAGRLRVAAESGTITISGTPAVTQSGTWNIATLTSLTNWGQFTAEVRSRVDSMQGYDMGYRRNLVVS